LHLVALALALIPAKARATPLDDPHIGGIGFSGPASDDLSALYWNPAALGLSSGTRFQASLTGQSGSRTVERAPIDPSTGQPGGSRAYAPVTGRADRFPVGFGPGSFLAVAYTVANRATLGFGTYTPFVMKEKFPAAADGSEPARYHAVEIDLSTIALSPAVSVRVAGGLRVGIATGFLLSNGRVVVDHDTGSPSGSAGQSRMCGDAPCGAENPAAAARYSVVSNTGFFNSAFSFTLGFGLHYDRPRWAAGIGYNSSPIGDRKTVEIEATATRINLPPRLGAGATVCPPGLDPCVTSLLAYRIPTTVSAGFDLHLTPRWDLGVQGRWLDLSVHDAIRVRTVGPAGGALRSAGLPEQLPLHRGLQDVFELRLRGILKLGARLQIAAGVRGETAAVPKDSMSPAVFGGAVIEPSLGVRVRLHRRFAIAAGYALALSPTVSTDHSVFDPSANAACETAGGDLDAPACAKRQQGEARPTAAGSYRAITQTFGLSLMAQL
jgi:long-subunit fatty acid transport protein